jgi:hypothetical protein
MGMFGRKKEKVVDWSEGYRTPSVRIPTRTQRVSRDEDNSSLGFVGDIANSNSSSSDVSWDNDSNSSSSQEAYPDKKQKLAKRLLDMTDKIEEMSNQIYHLKQRIELLEKKLKINFQ